MTEMTHLHQDWEAGEPMTSRARVLAHAWPSTPPDPDFKKDLMSNLTWCEVWINITWYLHQAMDKVGLREPCPPSLCRLKRRSTCLVHQVHAWCTKYMLGAPSLYLVHQFGGMMMRSSYFLYQLHMSLNSHVVPIIKQLCGKSEKYQHGELFSVHPVSQGCRIHRHQRIRPCRQASWI